MGNIFGRFLLLGLFTTLSNFLYAQAFDTSGLEARLTKHVYYLAADELGGRLTGSKFEKKAADYISAEFKKAGLQPKGTKGYLQHFSFFTGLDYGKNNKLTVDKQKLVPDKDFYPLAYSSNAKVSGKVIDAGFGIISETPEYNDYRELGEVSGKILLINLSLPGGVHPHSKYLDFADWKTRAETAKKKGASAIIFYNSENLLNVEAYKKYNNLQRETLPLIHVTEEVAEKIKAGAEVSFQTDLVRSQIQGTNVLAFLDNNAEKTVVIGAHFDHLGHGEYGNSLHAGETAIHNGADDNASGTAALVELAKLLKQNNIGKDQNFLFIAFSGEELGLLGSNYFTKNPTIELSTVSYMFNMDMVGRLDSTSKELGINGTGTSPVWDSLLKIVMPGYFSIKTTSTGMGSSDHTSFYLKEIPALHFFTGTHSDYHKPTDDAHKINYKGLADITLYIAECANNLNNQPKLVFQKTTDESTPAPSFKVTLGVMPDYFYDGKGLRVEGVTPGKPADGAGLKAGDIVQKLGEIEVEDMRSYMQALSKFKKGDETQVEVLRGDKKLTLQVKF